MFADSASELHWFQNRSRPSVLNIDDRIVALFGQEYYIADVDSPASA